MEITFATNKLQKRLNESKAMIRVYGAKKARILKIVLASLRAASNLGIFAPPYSPPNRCHELKGNLKGMLSIDLDHPYRLLFRPNHDPVPMKGAGGLDWSNVTAIEIKGVEDTHD